MVFGYRISHDIQLLVYYSDVVININLKLKYKDIKYVVLI